MQLKKAVDWKLKKLAMIVHSTSTVISTKTQIQNENKSALDNLQVKVKVEVSNYECFRCNKKAKINGSGCERELVFNLFLHAEKIKSNQFISFMPIPKRHKIK
jgi:hypothetical protein